MEEKKPVYLVMVTTNNNNKYYRMIPHGDTFDVEFGRVGATCQHASYPIRQWDKKYNEKIKKGYVDQTHLVQDLIQREKPKSKDGYKEIENKVIAEIVQRLQDMARQKIQANYKVSSQQVTQAMVDEAQNVIDSLMNKETLREFNDTLLKLFTVIPRKMGNVNDYIAKSDKDFAKILKDEQDLLDVMRGQVVTHIVENEPEEAVEEKQETIIEAMGLIFEEVDDSEVAMIKDMLGAELRGRYHKSWRVRNVRTQKRFDNFVEKEGIKNTKLLWHGSRNENWWSIINTGLVLRPTNAVITGKMFGYGLYYAPKAMKSKGYTSLDGYWSGQHENFGLMAIMDVAYGKPYDVHAFDSKYYNFNYERLQQACPGANCLHAHAGQMLRNDEIIVYKEDQCTIRYLVELR